MVECFSRGLFLDYSLKKLCVSKRCNVVIVLMDCDIVDFGDESPLNAPLFPELGERHKRRNMLHAIKRYFEFVSENMMESIR